MKIVAALLAALLAAAFVASGQSDASKEERKDGFKPLFKSRTLKQWRGDRRLWRINNGVIVGSTDDTQIYESAFLILKKEAANFHLRFQAKLRNGDSGVQFRSEELPDYGARGLQADFAQDGAWGSILDFKGKRGVIVNGWPGKAEKVVKPEDWNEYEIQAIGPKITIKVNGLVTAELEDSTRLSGVFALELHRGPAMKVYFRRFRIKRLP